MSADLALLGVRHHGPGSARAVLAALDEYKPDVILVEGPPEADGLVRFAADDEMRPPVAVLCYATGDARRAAFWPYAVFSPEWQALRYGAAHDIPVRFCDLPAAHQFAEPDRDDDPDDDDADGGDSDADRHTADGLDGADEADTPRPDDAGRAALDAVRRDPIAALAQAAGYDDAERWWDDVVEHRSGGAPAFAALAEAMAEVRADTPDGPDAEREARREAYMRSTVRGARRAGHERIAVVCGAWHVPALADMPTAAHDTALLKGLPKVKVSSTWVPWTHGRLASWRGYGAGVTSPGWYHHLFTAPDRVVERWLVEVARVLRDEDVPVSSAHVIEGARLAEALAALRNRPLAGLAELTEATEAVLCEGDPVRARLVDRRLVVGERLGAVPAGVPSVPLAADLAAEQRRLRLKPGGLSKTQDLDLRRGTDLARSRLLHRLRLLGIDWGTPLARRGSGTFRESWKLEWRPELAVDVVEAGAYGTTVRTAATAKARDRAASGTALAELTGLVEACLLAGLPETLDPVLHALDERVALDADVAQLLAAVPPLVRTLRYGDVRGTDTGALRTVTAGLLVRACAGLPAAVTGLDDGAAAALVGHLDGVHAALGLLPDDPDGLRERWLVTLAGLVGVPAPPEARTRPTPAGRTTDGSDTAGRAADGGGADGDGRDGHDSGPAAVGERDDLHGRVAGRITRILRDAEWLDVDETARRMGLVLTVGVAPVRAGAWVAGFLSDGGLLLVHDEAMLGLVDRWLTAIPGDSFVEVLPLLRRTFAEFAAPERRAIGESVRRGPRAVTAPVDDVVPERGALPLPTVATLLGLEIGG